MNLNSSAAIALPTGTYLQLLIGIIGGLGDNVSVRLTKCGECLWNLKIGNSGSVASTMKLAAATGEAIFGPTLVDRSCFKELRPVLESLGVVVDLEDRGSIEFVCSDEDGNLLGTDTPVLIEGPFQRVITALKNNDLGVDTKVVGEVKRYLGEVLPPASVAASAAASQQMAASV